MVIGMLLIALGEPVMLKGIVMLKNLMNFTFW